MPSIPLWFSTGGSFALQGTFGNVGDIFDCHNWEVGPAIGIKCVEAGDAAKYSAGHKMAPTAKNYLPQVAVVLRLRNLAQDSGLPVVCNPDQVPTLQEARS